jgi:hypothetical protein
MRVPEINSRQQHGQLLRRDFLDLPFRIRPGKPMFLKALLDQAESSSIPKEGFENTPL